MKITHKFVVVTALFLMVPSLYGVTWTTIDFPGAGLTELHGINSAGDMVGSYIVGDGFGPLLGFLDKGGVFTTINYPGSLTTKAYAINVNDDIVGIYTDSNNVFHGFLLQGQTYTSLDPPNSTNTFAQGINDSGSIVGYYVDGSSGGKIRGFVLSGGTYTPIDTPGSPITEVFGINDNGEITGFFTTGTGNVPTGFVLSAWVLTPLKFHSLSTEATAINDFEHIAGYVFNNHRTRGFIYYNGRFTLLNVPSAPQSTMVLAFGINDAGSVVGTFTDSASIEHGFLRTLQ